MDSGDPSLFKYCSYTRDEEETAWVGLRLDGDNLRWDDGSPVDFLNWGDAEPAYTSTNGKYCVVLNNGSLESESPREDHPSLCEMAAPLAVEPTCPRPFIGLGDRCILLNLHYFDWFGALQSCRNMCPNCTLASVHSQEELDILYDMLDEE